MRGGGGGGGGAWWWEGGDAGRLYTHRNISICRLKKTKKNKYDCQEALTVRDFISACSLYICNGMYIMYTCICIYLYTCMYACM